MNLNTIKRRSVARQWDGIKAREWGAKLSRLKPKHRRVFRNFLRDQTVFDYLPLSNRPDAAGDGAAMAGGWWVEKSSTK